MTERVKDSLNGGASAAVAPTATSIKCRQLSEKILIRRTTRTEHGRCEERTPRGPDGVEKRYESAILFAWVDEIVIAELGSRQRRSRGDGAMKRFSLNERWRHHPIDRRTLIQAGAVGFLRLGMSDLAALRAVAAKHPQYEAAKSVIFIYAVGGMSQLETFDMKPDGTAKIRGEFRPIPTNVPGLDVCEHLPMLARRAHLFSLVRSVSHPYTGHQQGHMVMQSGRTPLPRGFSGRVRRTDWPSIAALAGYASKSRNNLPQSVLLPELCYNDGLVSGQMAGMMGPRFDPWIVKASGTAKPYEGARVPNAFNTRTKVLSSTSAAPIRSSRHQSWNSPKASIRNAWRTAWTCWGKSTGSGGTSNGMTRSSASVAIGSG